MIVIDCALRTIETSVAPQKCTDAPLAFDYDYCSIGLAISCLLRLALVLPGQIDIQNMRSIFVKLFGHGGVQAAAWSHGPAIAGFISDIESQQLAMMHLNGGLGNRNQNVGNLLPPQRLDDESIRRLDAIACDNTVFIKLTSVGLFDYGPKGA